MKDPIENLPPLLTGLAVFLLYLAVPSFYHNFDGVACAIAVELGDFKHLVHGNHMLYGLAGYLFHQFCRLAGLGVNALWALQLLDSLLGALGAGLMHSLLRRQGFPERLSLLASLGMALSYGYWLWSLEAQVYLLGLVLLLLALGEALSERPSPYRLALWHALAMLSHGANVLFAPVSLYALGRRNEDAGELRSAVGAYLAASFLLVVLGYTAAGFFWVRPENLSQLKLWLSGSLALGPGRSLQWHGQVSARNILTWISTSARVVCVTHILSAPLWLCAFQALREHSPKYRPIVVSCWLWLPAYMILFVHWEPHTLVYRVSDLVPLWLLAAVGAQSQMSKALGRFACAAYVVLLGSANFVYGILPVSRQENNAALRESLWLKAETPLDAWVLVRNEDQVYVPYFAHRHTLNLNYFTNRPEALRERVSALLESKKPVFIFSSLLESGWREPLSIFELRDWGGLRGARLYQLLKARSAKKGCPPESRRAVSGKN